MTLTRKAFAILLGIAVALCGISLTAEPSSAASIRKATPKFKMSTKDPNHYCSYTNNHVVLFWYKVNGAKKYKIYRSAKKNGKYKLFATVKGKTSLKKKASGNYWYKLRAVSGKKKSKWSRPIHIIALTAKITKMSYEDVGYNGYVARSTVFRVQVTNKSNVGFTFPNAANCYTVWLAYKNSSMSPGQWKATLYIPEGSPSHARYLGPGETKYFRVFLHDAELDRYGKDGLSDKNNYYMITANFNADGGVRRLAAPAQSYAWDNGSIATYY